MDMQKEITNAIIIGLIYVLIFAGGESWRKFGKPAPEHTRKFVHVLSGVVCLSFSYVFQSHFTVLALALTFALIIWAAGKFGLLQSVHGISRKSQGGIYYPAAVYLTFLITQLSVKPHFYVISILVLAVSDTLAALIGTSYGRLKFLVEDDKKSLEGTVAFFGATFIIVLISLLFLTGLGWPESVLSAIYISILVTAFELLSLKGADNLLIPIGTIALLLRVTPRAWPETLTRLGLIILIFGLVYLAMLNQKKVGISGIIGVGLMCYGGQALMDSSWSYVLFFSVLFFAYSGFGKFPAREISNVRPVFFFCLISFIWILVSSFLPGKEQLFFTPFVFNAVAGMSVIWEKQLRRHKPFIHPLVLAIGFPGRCFGLSLIYILPYALIYPSYPLGASLIAIYPSVLCLVLLHKRLADVRQTASIRMREFAFLSAGFSLAVFYIAVLFNAN